jgi:hypothetical protein
LANEKVYHQWNGKNIHGKTELNNNFLASEAANSTTAEMNCTIGVETFSANDLQNDEIE